MIQVSRLLLAEERGNRKESPLKTSIFAAMLIIFVTTRRKNTLDIPLVNEVFHVCKKLLMHPVK